MYILIIIILCVLIDISVTLDCSKANDICAEYTENCEVCIQSHPCCDWCFMEDFSKPRCSNKILLEQAGCQTDFIFFGGNSNIKADGVLNETFNDPGANMDRAIVQIMPQKLSLQLRLKQPITFKLQYKATKNYPFDLYYLMDLTFSMKHDVATMINLASTIPNHLEDLTRHYKIAFGYYSDKVAMPFSFMGSSYLENPCSVIGETCERGYSFVHALNFTETIDDFIKMVNSSKTTGNIDDMEGGTDAIMQILACKTYVGWRKHSRKLIVIATDGTMHFAGDGILAGVTKRNSEFKCFLDNAGTYDNSLLYDYPSLAEIYRKLVENKVNVLFAAKDVVYSYYYEMNKVIPHISYVGKLDMKSENVLKLINESYTHVVRNVMFRVNGSDEVKFTFKSSCNKPEFIDNWNFTASCDNIEIGDLYTFEVTVELQKLPARNSDRFVIEELNIAEDVIIDVEYLGKKCSCNEDKGVHVDCVNGEYDCGKCLCEPGWTGKVCDILCNGENLCRFTNETYKSSTCYGNGECDLDTCKCMCDYDYMGEYCQYPQCKRNKLTNEICSGDSQGACIQGKCDCEKDFKGDDCSCRLSNATCFAPGYKEPCNGVGDCVCGECICLTGYTGAFCEYCANCTKSCDQYMDCILDTVNGKQTDFCTDGGRKHYTHQVDNFEGNQTLCIAINDKDGLKCKVEFTYKYNKGEHDDINVHLYYVDEPCSKPLAAGIVGFAIVALIILMGFLVLVIWKVKVTQKDKHEMQKFMKTLRDSSKWNEDENPLYRSPIRKYFNPMNDVAMEDVTKKSE